MLQDILSSQKPLFDAGVHTELRGQLNRDRRVTLLSGDIVSNTRSDISGVSARVYRAGTWGFSSMAEYTREAAEKVLRAASENAAFMEKHVGLDKPALPPVRQDSFTVSEDIHDPAQRMYVDFIRELDAYTEKHCPKLISRRFVATEDSMEKLLVCSDGMQAHTILPRSYCYAFFTAETPSGTPVDLFRAFGGEGTFDLNFTDPAEYYEKIDRLYEYLMQKREGVYADAGEKTVILGGMMTGMLAHEAVGHTVEADLVLGGSVAGHCLNKQVASEKVSLSDFANTAFGSRCPLPVFVDDEGTPASDVTLIKDGTLVAYMNNRESALHFGMEPAGNARAWLFSDEPLIRMRNTAIHPGTDKLEDMIASIDDGYYLIDSGNGQADTTGEFMFGVTMGYEIKHGKLGRALLDTTISGVAFEMLKTVDMVGDAVQWSSSGFCGKKQRMPVGLGGPALRCKVMIGGR
ncbi:MAG: TldD/PmbA family protein [Oscillospiraceae bacterium]|nr:TldD/PmbA family protein [Oscillospiraceae bacterium]